MEEINKLKIDLGPMWNEMELGVFLKSKIVNFI